MKLSAKTTVVAEPLEKIDLQLFAEGSDGGAPAVGGSPGIDTSGQTSSIIPGDGYASGGPEPPDTQSAEAVDMEGFSLDTEPEEGEGLEPEAKEPEIPEAVKGQSPEANAAFAEMRREAEAAKQQALFLQQQLVEKDAWVEQTFGSQGIHNWQQYQQAVEQTHRQQALQRQQDALERPKYVAQQTYQKLIEAGYEEVVAKEIANNQAATVAQAIHNQQLQERLAAIEQQEKQREFAAFQQHIYGLQQEIQRGWNDEYSQLQKEYGDMLPLPAEQYFANIEQPIADKLSKGYTLQDAWLTTYNSTIKERATKAAQQKTLNNLDSKRHLKTEGDGAGESASASATPLHPDTLAMYMANGMSEKQARAFHKKIYG